MPVDPAMHDQIVRDIEERKAHPKHKRVLRDGQTTRGQARWLRAADNAMRNPESKGGRLFWHRTSVAHRITKLASFEGPFEHVDWTYTRSGSVLKRTAVTCSRFCMAMTVQLDWGPRITNDYQGPPATFEQITDWLMTFERRDQFQPRAASDNPDTEYVRSLEPGVLRRPKKCQFCGTAVQPL